ncbi:MAG: hypothetical protein QOJ39_2276 [Candidatus Eremiobacteraeota bacterium]|nr:hypothetical protein [Candidatus Eremiobacteraeota bacterium]
MSFMTAMFIAAASTCAFADDPAPAPSASPQSTAAAAPPQPAAASQHSRLRIALASSVSYVNQQFVGPGTLPPEAGAFAAGQPIAPGTPYDMWTSSPNVNGYGVNHSLLLMPAYALSPQYDLRATLGYGSISGNANVAAYWGDQAYAALNPHLGFHAAAIAFPTGNHGDPIASTAGGVVSFALARHDGRFVARAGWFDVSQGESFVVNQPAQTNTPMLFTEPLPEGIGDAPETLPLLVNARTRLPLRGLDIVAKPREGTGIELIDAELPEPPGTHARLQSVSLDVARPGRVSFGAQLARVVTGGAPIGTSVLFGSDATVMPTDQGPLPTSSLRAQKMTVGGVRADLPIDAHASAQVRLGMSCYAAEGTGRAQRGCAGGRYASARLQRTTDAFSIALDAMHMDATYAPAILPYGMPENLWGPAYAWPGTWI